MGDFGITNAGAGSTGYSDQPVFPLNGTAAAGTRQQVSLKDKVKLKKIFDKIGVPIVNKDRLVAYLTAHMPYRASASGKFGYGGLDTSGYVRTGLATEGSSGGDYGILANQSGILAINFDLVIKLANKNALQSDNKDKVSAFVAEANRDKKSYAIQQGGFSDWYASLNDIADYILDGNEWLDINHPGKLLGEPKLKK